MGGKTNLSATLFAQKKLLGKSSTGVHRADNNEPIPSGLQVATSTVFAENVPSSPSRTAYLLQSASDGANATVEYVDFLLQPITGSVYDANTFDSSAGAQGSGTHAYRLVLTGNYETLSSNTRKGKDYYKNDQILHWTLGSLQLVSPGFSNDVPNPYNLLLFSGSRDVEDEIPLQDELDWQIDYFSGVLFVQDFDSGKIPTRAKGFIYVGQMLSASIGQLGGGGGSGTGVGWFGSAPGTISSTGSVLIGTNTSNVANAEISFSSVGGAVFNEKGRSSNFRVESAGSENALFIKGSSNQVFILSGGAGSSPDPGAGSDISFYVSGSIDSKGGNQKGVSLFGGDVVSSGSFSASNGISGSLTRLHDGKSYLVAGSNITIASASNGQVTISSTGGGGGGTPAGSNTQIQFNNGGSFGGVSGATTDGSAITFNDSGILVGQDITHAGDTDTKITFGDDAIGFTAGGEQLLTISEAGTDIVTVGDGGDVDFRVRTNNDDNTLYIEGSSDRIGIGTNSPASIVHISEAAPTLTFQRENNSNASTIDFLGHSGNTANSILHDSSTNDLVFKTFNGSTVEEIMRIGDHYGTPNRQVIFLSGSNIAASDMQPRQANDISFFVSGAIGSRGTANKGTSVFGGDLVSSGSLQVKLGLSGSLTRLHDGKSYIRAGSNITIASASNGQITISASSAGNVNFSGGNGNNNQMITADGSGDIVAESNISFDGSKLMITGSVLPGADKVYDLGGPNNRFANVYTGDLHLRNERGHWTIVEEAEYLTVINNLTGKKYKMVLEPLD